MRIFPFEKRWESRYLQFLMESEDTLFYSSPKYLSFLGKLLRADSLHLIAVDGNDQVVGALPAFRMGNDKYGDVINSLPFFGSNGGVLGRDANVKEALLRYFYSLTASNGCAASTLIGSPLQEDDALYREHVCPCFIDRRIGQFVELPAGSECSARDLLETFHPKTRNAIRKSEKQRVDIDRVFSDEAWFSLSLIHHKNMEKIAGKSKPPEFFDLAADFFMPDRDYAIYTGRLEGKIIAALLLFYFNRTVEYFTPVVLEEYRDSQALSGVIYRSMLDAASEGFKWWNWGGTWLSQEGVYRFKSRWGTVDKPYRYYVTIHRDTILRVNPETIQDQYPFFYVFPFKRNGPEGAATA